MSEKMLDTTSWQNRLPGHPGYAAPAAYSNPNNPQSPQALYDYILANVPGISPEAASWLHTQVFSGQPLSAWSGAPHDAPALLPGGARAPVDVNAGGGSWLDQVYGLPVFHQAPTVQPLVPGGAQYLHAGGPLVPGTPGTVGWTNPNDPHFQTSTTGTGGTLNLNPPPYTLPTYKEIGIPTPPPVVQPHWNTPGNPRPDDIANTVPNQGPITGYGAPPGGIDYGDYGVQPTGPFGPPGGIDYGNYGQNTGGAGGHPGPGAMLAESALGYKPPRPVASPVHYMRGFRL